jgi:hypothetical protein
VTVRVTAKDAQNAERELCQRSFAEFIRLAWPHVETKKFVANWHIDVLADHLQAMAEGRANPRLLINICPGSAKSLIVSVMFPAWLWTRFPSKRIISTSHKEKLAIRDSVKCRRLISSDWYQRYWPTTLRDDQNAKAAFENDSNGSREAMPFGSMTGSRGDVVIVDDPLSVKEAKSAAYRETNAEIFLEAIPSRVNDLEHDLIIVVMQRLHEDDIAGIILANPELGYDHLCIPLFADGETRPPTSIGWVDPREEGENMHPDRFTANAVARAKASLGPFAFAGQYQQRPVPANDGYFIADWFHRYTPDELPTALNYIMTSDHAPGGRGDFNVIRIWGIDARKNIWLVDSFRKKCMMDEAIGVIRDPETGKARLATAGALPLIAKYKPSGWFPENDATWAAIQSFVQSAMIETNTFTRIAPLATKGSGDKMGKAQAYQAMASMELVHLPIGQVGDDALAEYATFPNGKHDDQVDADGAVARVIGQMPGAYLAPAPINDNSDFYDIDGIGSDTSTCF